MSKFGLGAVESTSDKPKKEIISRVANLINGIVTIDLTHVKVDDAIYPIEYKSMDLSSSNRFYVRNGGTVILKTIKDSDLYRNVYSIYKAGLTVSGYVVDDEFRVIYVTYPIDDKIKLKR
jgi:hypothetical protein